MLSDITKNIVAEIAGTTTEGLFTAIATGVGFPAAAFAAPLAKGLILGLVENCFNDCLQMTLSVSEKKKLTQVSSIALQTFWEMAKRDGIVAWEMSIDPANIDYAYEVAEHATLEAIRQSEKKKIDVLGRYYGNQFYKGRSEWQDMHQIITMVGSLTFRQIVMIRLISEGFIGMNRKLFISNPSACVEINRLKDYGIWQTCGAAFGINESVPIQLDGIIATFFSECISKELMLDRLSDSDIHIVLESLGLTEKGTPQAELTEDEFRSKTSFAVEGGALVLPGGKKYGGDPDEELFLRDLARGK